MKWDIIGHQWAVDLLQNHIEAHAIRHAYLITGPKSTGRRTLALRFTQALNCPDSAQHTGPCLTCRTCRRIEKMEHPDLFPVQAEADSLDIKVDQIRELIHNLSLSNYEAPYRIALLLDFDDANDAAANALLKTLEEPPPNVVLILTAESSDHLLETIVSRCEEVQLRPIPIQTIQEGLQDLHQLPSNRANFLAHICGGRPGYAIRLHQNPDLETQRSTWLEDHRHLLQASRVERFSYVKQYRQDAESLREMIQVWQSYWRDVMHTASNAHTPKNNIDREDEIETIAQHLEPDQARQTLTNLNKALHHLMRYANTQLTAEVLVLDLPKINFTQ